MDKMETLNSIEILAGLEEEQFDMLLPFYRNCGKEKG